MSVSAQEAEYMTDYVALAATLKLLGHEPVEMVWDGNFCSWVFNDGPDLQDLVTQFESGNLQVEPKRFASIFTDMKRDMFRERDGRRH